MNNDNDPLYDHKDEISDTIECPMCSEIIKAKAVKCRYCGHMLSSKNNNIGNEVKQDIGNFYNNIASNIKKTLTSRHKSEVIIIISLFLLFLSLITPWYYFGLVFGKHIASSSMIYSNRLIAILLLIAYPLVTIIIKNKLSFKISLICSLVLLYKCFTYMHFSYFSRTTGALYDPIMTVSFGPWFACIGSIVFFVGVLFIPRK